MSGNEIIGKEELNSIREIFLKSNGVLFAHGFDSIRNGHYEIRELEKKAADYFKSKYCIAVSSGTAGLKVALKCCNLSPGDNIISQAHNFISDGEVIIDYNCVPRILNVDESLNLDDKLTLTLILTFILFVVTLLNEIIKIFLDWLENKLVEPGKKSDEQKKINNYKTI